MELSCLNFPSNFANFASAKSSDTNTKKEWKYIYDLNSELSEPIQYLLPKKYAIFETVWITRVNRNIEFQIEFNKFLEPMKYHTRSYR